MSSSVKQHWWLVSFSVQCQRTGKHRYGNCQVSYNKPVFTKTLTDEVLKRIKQQTSDVCIIVSVSYLGEMTWLEATGETNE